jgi:hypothetical protein
LKQALLLKFHEFSVTAFKSAKGDKAVGAASATARLADARGGVSTYAQVIRMTLRVRCDPL